MIRLTDKHTQKTILLIPAANGDETGYWAASGEAITLQSVTTAGNTTTEGISIASANIASDSVTIGPTNGEIVGGYVVANAVSNTAIVWRGIQTDDTVTSEISATGAASFTSLTVNGEPVGGGGFPCRFYYHVCWCSSSRRLVDL